LSIYYITFTDEFYLSTFFVAPPQYLQALADGVIPNEYGINPSQKLKIGSKVTSSCKEYCKLPSMLQIFKEFP